jgi:predicted MFS family arabinose efflux permease
LLGLTVSPGSVKSDLGDTKPTLFSLLLGGFAEVLSKPMLLLSLLMMTGGYFSIFLFDRFTPILVRNLGFAQDVYSLAVVAVGAGGVLGALGVGTVSREDKGFDLIVFGALGVGILLFVIGGRPIHGVTLSAAAFIGVFFGLGVLTPLVVVPFNTILQREADASRVGSVFAVNEALNVGAMLTAPFVGAIIAETYGMEAPFLIGAAGMSGVAMLALVVRLARSRPFRTPTKS